MSEQVVKVIKANPFAIKNESAVYGEELKVAAYARVSTDSSEQEDSFERQVDYYTRFIQSNPKWKFVKVYSDPGISGTRADKRPGFLQMIEDCHKGLINRILVKSIARFARNTVDALKYIRDLKDIGVTIYFESQNLDTGTAGGEVLLTILAAMAEEESRTMSKNIRWAYQKKFEKGDFTIDYKNFLGYTRDENHNFVIVPEEAEIIRRIYREYLYGYSIKEIKRRLEKDNVKTPRRKDKWYYNTIRSILTNEKYYGAVLMGKTYKPDVLSPKRFKNEGQVEQYFVEHAFEGIVTKEQFDMVQMELKRRAKLNRKFDKNYGQYSCKRAFSKKVKCGVCGSFYISTTNMRIHGERIHAWWCDNSRKKDATCMQKGISEESLKKGFVKVLNELIQNHSDIEALLSKSLVRVLTEKPTEKIEAIDKKIETLQTEMFNLAKRRSNGEINSVQYGFQGEKLAESIDKFKKEKDALLESYSNVHMAKSRIQEVLDTIRTFKPLEEFDEEIFRRLIDVIVVNDRTRLTYKFKVGIERTIESEIK